MSSRRCVGRDMIRRIRNVRFPGSHAQSQRNDKSNPPIGSYNQRDRPTSPGILGYMAFETASQAESFQVESSSPRERIGQMRLSIAEGRRDSIESTLMGGPLDAPESPERTFFELPGESYYPRGSISQMTLHSNESRRDSIESTLTSGPFDSSRTMIRMPFGIYAYAGRRETARNEEPLVNQASSPRPVTPNATALLRTLQFVAIDELSEDRRSCSICHEPFLDSSDSERPVILPCGHVFGQACINRWLSPDDADPKSTCPYCRRRLFEVPNESAENVDDDNFLTENTGTAAETHDEVDIWREINTVLPRIGTDVWSTLQEFDQRWSQHMSNFTHRRPYVPRLASNPPITREVLRSFRSNTAPSMEEAIGLSEDMGQLYIRFRMTMRLLKFLPMWNEYGPPPEDLMEPESRRIIETALQRLLLVEDVHLWASRGV